MWSCVKVSEGCTHCYAERLNERRGGPPYAVGKDTLRLDEKILAQPLRWKKPRRIFVCSMTDLFEERVPDEWIVAIWKVMAFCGQHTFQVLTKRAERMQAWVSTQPYLVDLDRSKLLPYPPPNVWLGVSVENQARADERIPWLLKTPATVRFLSVEPLLGPVDIRPHFMKFEVIDPSRDPRFAWEAKIQRGIHWVIVGGESGGPPERALVTKYWPPPESMWEPKANALDWVRSLRDQCVAAGVPFFFKQFGGPTPKSGGRLLDGKEWSQFPS